MMTTQFVGLFNAPLRCDPAARPVVIERAAAGDDRRLSAARGIILAVLLAVPFWAVVGTSLYYLR